MATIALRVPTTGPDGQTLIVGGHCYIVFPDPTITVRDLISEKVRAELRKARAGGPHTSSVNYLIDAATMPNSGFTPELEELAVERAIQGYVEKRYQLWIEGAPIYNRLTDEIGLTRRTRLAFAITEPLPAGVYNVPRSQRGGWLDQQLTERDTTNNAHRRFHWSVAVSPMPGAYFVVSVDTLEHVVFVHDNVSSVAAAYAYYQDNADKEITSWFGNKE